MRVLVVGAGLAGLSAAERLLDAGADVVVVEAGGRAGGRVRTVTDPFAAGQYAESGAEWVDTDHHRMQGLMRRFGVEPLGRAESWTMVRRLLFRHGRLLRAEDLAAIEPDLNDRLEAYDEAFERIADGIADPARPDLHPDAALHDARSMADLIADTHLGEAASLFAHRNAQGEFAEEPSGVSALFVAQQRAQQRAAGGGETVRAHRVRGGLRRVVEPWAAGVDARLAGGIRFGHRLVGLSWNDDGVEAELRRSADGGTSRVGADHVVLACSLAALRTARVDPVLPEPFATAVASLGYGDITKTAVQFAARRWPHGYTSTDLAVQRVYDPTADQPGEPGIVMAYTGGDGGRRLGALAADERQRLVVADMETIYAEHGPLGAPLAAFTRAWGAVDRFGGAYAAYRPGQVVPFWQVLREPCGRVHLAGEHVATWTGYMEGAVESGETVAARLVGWR